jgi:uncharacterized protein YbjT (DUF2867 family)
VTTSIPEAATTPLSVVMLGASGAVGGEAVNALLAMPNVSRVTLLNRRTLTRPTSARLTQHIVDPLDASSYRHLLVGHTTAICTLGVGQPTQVSKQELVRIDKTAVLDFGRACREAGVGHFELLSAVAAHAASSNHYLRTKGELQDALAALGFLRLSVFQPSMILTPTNRYDWKQAVVLSVWPKLSPLLAGPLRKYRGVRVEALGRAMARNLARPGAGVETLHWPEFQGLQ